MNLLDRVFAHPCLCDAPPVLVDVGASGEIHPLWRRIARYSIGVGFEPDARHTARLVWAHSNFRRWIICDKLVVANEAVMQTDLHLTQSPFCSSTLLPDKDALADYAFSNLFEVKESRSLPATTLVAALRAQGLVGIDWLKCDTQGTDLRIFQSLPETWRRKLLAVEFEPGLINAYAGEDKLYQVLAAMEREPFWLSRMEVNGSPRARMAMLQSRLGASLARRYYYLGPPAPGWVNALYLHKTGAAELDLRDHLLLWVFATELAQPSFACEVAEAGAKRFDDALCSQLAVKSVRHMRRAVWRTWPRWPELLWRKVSGLSV